jgi:hypothetical protein
MNKGKELKICGDHMNFHLLGSETKIEVEILGRNYPNSIEYWDVNWASSKIKIDIPGYSVRFIANLRTDELSSFVTELKLMNQNLKGKATLDNMDGYLQFECVIDKLGNINWSGETCYPAGYGAVLTFEFESDQSYLEKLIKELEYIQVAFPVIGKP